MRIQSEPPFPPRARAGLEDLVSQLKALAPALIAVEATGGFEMVVAAALTSAGLPVVVVNPAQVGHYRRRSASGPRPTRSTRR